MDSNSAFLRPLAITAGLLGTVQAIVWGVLSLLGILVYTEDIEVQQSLSVTYLFQTALVDMYFRSTPTIIPHMTPETVAFWTSIYFATSVIWFGISVFLLYESYNYRFTSKVIIGWVAVSALIVAIDFAGTVAFGVDHYRVQRELDQHPPSVIGVEYLLAPIFMMIMCSRGFILWIINFGLLIYLGVAERKLYKKGSPNSLKDPDYSSHISSFDNHYYNSMGSKLHSSANPGFINHGRQNIEHAVNPIIPIPRPGKPFPNPVIPLPSPQPVLSPQMRRQNHEPKMNEAPARSVQMQRNSQRESYY